MTRSLPPVPNMEHLKKQAKDLLKSHRNGNSACGDVLRRLKRFEDQANEMILSSELSLNEAQMALALDYGYKSWSDLKKHVLGRLENLKFLHIHCGDASAQPLRNSSVPGDVLVWREIYIEGPVPGNVSQDDFNRIRADYISRTVNIDFERVSRGTADRYKTLEEAGQYEEVVLWFDGCMFDQTIMIHLIDECSRQSWPGKTKLSLICVEPGLGSVPQDELVSLMDIRQPISSEQIALARAAWRAFRSDSPTDIETVVSGDCSSLPFLKAALIRHLEQYPSVRNGLNRTQRQILQTIDDGASALADIFVNVSNLEEQPFMGDTSLWLYLDQLATCDVPLIKLDGPGNLRGHINSDPALYDSPSLKDIKRWKASLTPAGKNVLEAKDDHIKLNGVDQWLGGVHLQGGEASWRWDDQQRKLASCS